MPLLVNLRHLDAHNARFEGEMPLEELDIDTKDEVIQLGGPLQYALEVQKLEDGLLVQGNLRLPLDCECVRCLKRFKHLLKLEPWTLHLPLKGEDATPVSNDLVDLTPPIREDILLEFPQHPLCDAECRGLPKGYFGKAKSTSSSGPDASPTAWNELNKLKL